MFSVQRLVSPKLPTALANHTHVDLAGQDVWLYYTHGVLVLPAKLDVHKFEDALSRVLQLYPHAAGHLRCAEGRWSIELSNSPVPLSIDYKPDVNSDSLLDGDWVVQEDLSQFLGRQPSSAELVNGDAPLILVKLTFFEQEMSIGVSWNHSLGDGMVTMGFMHTLSRFYQGLPSEFTAPTFQKFHFPQPSGAVVAEFSSHLPLGVLRNFDDTASAGALKDVGHVKWRINIHDLEELRSALCSKTQNGKFLSKQDCLTAYVVAVLNSSRTSPMQRVTNTSSYRHVNAPFIKGSVAGNMLLFATGNVPTDMTGIATAIRDMRIRSREPDYIYNLEMLTSKHLQEAANAGKPPPFPADDAMLVVNSHVVIDWYSVHFGYPDGIRGYTGGLRKHYLKCSRSNLVRGDDGVWRDRPSVEISIGVPVEMKPKVLETLARGVRYMLDDRSARL